MTDNMRSTVLVVDDTPDNLLLINGILSDRYDVKVATNGATTLRIARSDNPPDLILLDITMSGMDGYEVCRQLKSDPSTRDIPVIFLTARTEVEDEKRGLELGAADYITRPISPPIVMARVRTHLDLKAAADSLRNKNQFLESLNDELEYRIAKEVGKNREKDSQLLHQDKMASIGQLAAGVAHEINNPMGYIISNLASLSKYVDKLTSYLDATEHYFAGSESGTREYLAQERNKYKIDRIRQDLPELICESQEGAERVRKIIQDLKSFSRLDNSTGEFSDINKGLESTMTIAWNELKYKATVTREYGQLPLVWCNMGQLNQVFLNILVNAAHAIEGQGEIRIATWAAAESVNIAISDNGCGIAPEDVKRIFDPFFTTKEVGKGTGLGLAIAYDIVVNKHGGIIDVTSEIDTGTTFTITLPVKRE